MTAREWYAIRDGHIRLRLLETGGLDNLALDPSAVGFAGNGLDREPEEREPVVGVFEPRIGLDHWRVLKIGHQFLDARERTAILEIPGIGAVAHNAGAVRKELADRRFADLRMQTLHVLANRVVQAQLAAFAQLHDAGSGETLGMRGDAETVARSERLARGQIGRPECSLEGDLVALHDERDAAGLPGQPHLEFEP